MPFGFDIINSGSGGGGGGSGAMSSVATTSPSSAASVTFNSGLNTTGLFLLRYRLASVGTNFTKLLLTFNGYTGSYYTYLVTGGTSTASTRLAANSSTDSSIPLNSLSTGHYEPGTPDLATGEIWFQAGIANTGEIRGHFSLQGTYGTDAAWTYEEGGFVMQSGNDSGYVAGLSSVTITPSAGTLSGTATLYQIS